MATSLEHQKRKLQRPNTASDDEADKEVARITSDTRSPLEDARSRVRPALKEVQVQDAKADGNKNTLPKKPKS